MRTLVFGITCGVLGIALLISSVNENSAPKEIVLERLTGVASHYGMNDGFHGECMSNGRIFDKNLMTAAHWSLPLGTKARVRYQNRSVVVDITDRGPRVYHPKTKILIKERMIDLSEAAARQLGFIQKGVVPVVVEVLWKPEISQTYHHENPRCLKAPGELNSKTMVARSS